MLDRNIKKKKNQNKKDIIYEDNRRYEPKVKMYNISKYQLELENNLADAWKERQERLSHLSRKQMMHSIDNSTVLYRKIRNDAKIQENKFIRNDKPAKPKLEPLPYLRKIREKISKSIEMPDSALDERTPSPQETYVTKRVQFELVAGLKKNPLKRQDTKKFYTEIKSKIV